MWEDHLWCFQSIHLVQSIFFHFSKEQLGHAKLVFSFDRKFEKSLGTFDFGDFIIIYVAESLFVFPAVLMGFSK